MTIGARAIRVERTDVPADYATRLVASNQIGTTRPPRRQEWLRGPHVGAGRSNDNSVVMRLSDGCVHFLLTGDIERGTEEALIAENEPLAPDFLKVPASRKQDFVDDGVFGGRCSSTCGGSRRPCESVWSSGARGGGAL